MVTAKLLTVTGPSATLAEVFRAAETMASQSGCIWNP
jgi:hypothetical protein